MENQQPNNDMSNPMEEYQREIDRQDEAKHDAATIMAEKFGDIMGIEDPEERAKLVEGYRALFGGGPKFSPSPATYQMIPGMMPAKPEPLPDSCCTTVNDIGGDVVTLDWSCLLARVFKQVFHPSTNTSTLYLTKAYPLNLDKRQTRHLFKWLSAMKKHTETQPYGISAGMRFPNVLLSHPAVVSIIESPDE